MTSNLPGVGDLSEVSRAESGSHCLWNFGFGEYQASSILRNLGLHLLLDGDRFGASLFRTSSSDSCVRFGLIGL